MEPIASFQGLATGINFRDLVDQIIEAESAPARLMERRIQELDRKTTAWGDFEARVGTLFDRSRDLSDGLLFTRYSSTVSGGSDALSVSAGETATPGSFSVDVLQLATREKLSGASFQDRTAALGVSGEFLVGGRAVTVTAGQSLDDVAASINEANRGSSPSEVSASVVAASGGGYRLVLTADRSGAEGLNLADGAGGALVSLGLLDGTTSIRHVTSDGATSDGYASSTTAVGSLLGLSSAPSGTVTVGGFDVALDLGSQSLDDVAGALNAAAVGAGSSVTAQVVSETVDGSTVKRLDISGTTAFSDDNGVLETLGVLEGGRSAMAQAVRGAALTDGDGTTAASSGTLLTDLWVGGTAAGVTAGDTLTFSGTRGDGTTFATTFTVTAGSTYQDLVDALNSDTDGFQTGSRTATAAVSSDGRIVVTDDTKGESRLALSVVANNEGGGTLDFGTFETSVTGRAREVTDGRDAELLVDGAFYSRSTNTVSDVVEGVSLSLASETSAPVTVEVGRDVDAIVLGVEKFIKAYNAVSEYVNSQFTGSGAEEGRQARPLSGEGTVRAMRTRLREALEASLGSAVTDVSRLSELGISLNREGTYEVDTGALRTAIEADPTSVARFFGEYGAGSTGSLEYVGAGDSTGQGTYDVAITQVAARASATGAGFGGSYVDDGTADMLSVTDAGTGSVYEVGLSDGMSLTQIVDALNAEFSTETRRELQATAALKSDALGTAATDTTLLRDLHSAAGTNLGVADGDTFTISGTRDDGSNFFREWVVTDATTQTLGDLEASVSDALGADVVVTVGAGGVLTATASEVGRGSFTLSVSSDNAGGGTFSLGSMDVVEGGRNAARITASQSGAELRLEHDEYGAGLGFDVAYAAGGSDGSASLGLAAGTYRGQDVAGTINGQSASGSGRVLTAAQGTAADGLIVRYTGGATGSVGTVTYAPGIAGLVERVADDLLDTGAGTIKGVVDSIDTQIEGIRDRIELFQGRLDRRAESLIERFSELERAMAEAQSQAAWLQSQLASLAPVG